MRIGLIVNPVAGLGGRVGLKGSDGDAVQARAVALGAVPQASSRAALALAELRSRLPGVVVATAAAAMGADAARTAGFSPEVVYVPGSPTTPTDTISAARALRGVDLLLFAGGDGTARDVLDGFSGFGAVLGIPTGVKMHSAVFGVSPRAAGEVAAAYLGGLSGRVSLRDGEVMDLDENAVRDGRVSARLYGYLPVPHVPLRVQQRKAGSSAPTPEAVDGIAAEVAARCGAGAPILLGPGTTTRAVASALGFEVPVMGVNLIALGGTPARAAGEAHPAGGAPAAASGARDSGEGAPHPASGARDSGEDAPSPGVDLSAAAALRAVEGRRGWIVVTPIGGQGFLLGRGNQQISPEVLRAVGRDHLLVVATEAKLAGLGGRPLLVDTGDDALDLELDGYIPVITGRGRSTICRITH